MIRTDTTSASVWQGAVTVLPYNYPITVVLPPASRTGLEDFERGLKEIVGGLGQITEAPDPGESLIEVLEDAQDISDAERLLADAANLPLIPWRQIKAELDLP